jgi:tripartite-type tricarboxylate transporter receptor subunit TctC
MVGPSLSERLGQSFVVEHLPGASSNLGIEAVVRAPADGYTLLLFSTTSTINATLYDKLNFNIVRDIAPVALVTRAPSVMVVHPSFPAKTVPEFIALAKGNPNKIKFASGGNGTLPHVLGELFRMMAGIELVHVPYPGVDAALVELGGGRVEACFPPVPVAIELVRAGKLRPLAGTAATRVQLLPGVPAVSEFLPGYEGSNWQGVGAPRDISPEITNKLNKEINATLNDPKMKARLADLGSVATAGSPDDFGKLIAEETAKWAKVIKFAGIKAG